MSTAQLVKEIDKLPLLDKLRVVEQVLHGIREKEQSKIPMAEAAALLLPDYLEDEELTAFTIFDSEDFYEAK